MKSLVKKLIIVIIAFLCFISCKKEAENPPNIIYILADDLGYGDLSCYGQKNFNTPNLDRLAAGGLMFLQHYSGSTVCAPSRSSLMTGQHTGHTPIRGNREWKPEGQVPLPGHAFTLAELLKENGYVTGAFGKWGLGYPGSEGDPNNQGFDVFYGYNCQRIAHHYYPWHLWHNQEKVVLAQNKGDKAGTYAPNLIHEKALDFIEKNRDNQFFLYYPDYFNSNGNYRGYKRDLYEGGIRIPMIAWWPEKIKLGRKTDHLSAFWDVMPTLADVVGADFPEGIDGISFLPTLLGEQNQQEHSCLYWEFHEKRGRQAVRQGDWKLVKYNVFQPENTVLELYHIPSGPGEEKNMAKENMDIVEELIEIMENARIESEVFEFGIK